MFCKRSKPIYEIWFDQIHKISSFWIYRWERTIVIAGSNKPTKGTKIEGRIGSRLESRLKSRLESRLGIIIERVPYLINEMFIHITKNNYKVK